ncbi:hypothetical protein H8356DRAFT_1366713 [Neocallimastix lanati (nom. inval.)]|uniref:Lipoprotein n=1 Tax=Neocallimastix californiae TaxID=1754190 RepID=A0A1Y2AIU8_9FUNG|nr:hypothetical protein H8356DRAFT_1366713 [Neocallimastix sp. JGI-2020a]ORY22117.1 hypothetical protein LY90DRAFT_632243 [Neocallimastix californiae]|eukprot:ORY22117.1 hypothetical protein LY90DRAFT_632243 [Neocallimastix californiae]
MKFYLFFCLVLLFTFNCSSILKVEASVANLYFPKNSKSQTKVIDSKENTVKLTLIDNSGNEGILYDCRYKYYYNSDSNKSPRIYCELPLKKDNKVYKLSIHITSTSKKINQNTKINSAVVAKETSTKSTITNYIAKVSNINNLKLNHTYYFNGRFNVLTVDRTDSRKTGDFSIMYDYFEVIEIYKNTQFKF